MRPTQVEPSTRFANRALDSGERFLRRRSLYPTELRAHDVLIIAHPPPLDKGCPWIFLRHLPKHKSRRDSRVPGGMLMRLQSYLQPEQEEQSPQQVPFFRRLCMLRSASVTAAMIAASSPRSTAVIGGLPGRCAPAAPPARRSRTVPRPRLQPTCRPVPGGWLRSLPRRGCTAD